ncbi:MAG: hypothetical protein II961_09435 [Candidatus Riflebacteria bacterium]|nr:hypothetical protein [Candidatus Riflebacteria bacterium]
MKYLKYIIAAITIFFIYSQCSAHNQDFTDELYSTDNNTDKKQNILSVKEIDLLVGTPEGVAEPLDSRRNTITKDNQIDYSSFLTDDALPENSKLEIEWKDAEDSNPNENQVENQLMDLLAETEEIEKADEIYYYEENELATDSNNI